MIRIQVELFERLTESHDVLGHRGQAAVALVDVVNLPIACLEERYAPDHFHKQRTDQRFAKTRFDLVFELIYFERC